MKRQQKNKLAKHWRSEKLNSWRMNARLWPHYVDNDPYRRPLFSRVIDVCSNILAQKEPKRLLDLGCGEGLFLRICRSAWRSCSFSGLDFCTEQIFEARQRTPEVQFGVGDFERVLKGVHGTFDVVSSQLSFIEAADLSIPFYNAQRLVDADGIVVVTILEPLQEYDAAKTNGSKELTFLKGPRIWLVKSHFSVGSLESPAQYLRFIRPVEDYIRAAQSHGLQLIKTETYKGPSQSGPCYSILIFQKFKTSI